MMHGGDGVDDHAYTLLLYAYVGSCEREEESTLSYHAKVVWIEETS